MILDIKNFEISGVKLFSIKSYDDNRGAFSEVFLSKLHYPEFKIEYIQENESVSKLGVFRGMHFQKGKYVQTKLIRVVSGKVLEFVCDLRRSSPSFKKIITFELKPNKILFLPKGLAHGFLSLEKKTILNYKCDNYYEPKSEAGFNIFKRHFDIDFRINKEKIIMSKKDIELPSFDDSYIFEKL